MRCCSRSVAAGADRRVVRRRIGLLDANWKVIGSCENPYFQQCHSDHLFRWWREEMVDDWEMGLDDAESTFGHPAEVGILGDDLTTRCETM